MSERLGDGVAVEMRKLWTPDELSRGVAVVCDDDDQARRGIARMLKIILCEAGVQEICTFATAEEAGVAVKANLSQQDPSLVLIVSDNDMEERGAGLALAVEINRYAPYRKAPFVLLSGHDFSYEASLAHRRGSVDARAKKPLFPTEFADVIIEGLRRRIAAVTNVAIV